MSIYVDVDGKGGIGEWPWASDGSCHRRRHIPFSGYVRIVGGLCWGCNHIGENAAFFWRQHWPIHPSGPMCGFVWLSYCLVYQRAKKSVSSYVELHVPVVHIFFVEVRTCALDPDLVSCCHGFKLMWWDACLTRILDAFGFESYPNPDLFHSLFNPIPLLLFSLCHRYLRSCSVAKGSKY